MNELKHIPVLLDEMLTILSPKDGGVYIDATFGAGGYSNAILSAADCQVFAIDRDKEVQPFFDKISASFPDKIKLFIGKFSEMYDFLQKSGINKVDGIVFDVGVSSMQLEDANRGFSFMKEGPLDMRMSPDLNVLTAEKFVNTLTEKEIADTLYNFGGERCSRKIAKAIVTYRKKKQIKTTTELRDIIHSVIPRRGSRIDPATRSFQAIRIWVNSELVELEIALKSATEFLLDSGSKIIVITFHSLEDSIVKTYFRRLCGKNTNTNNEDFDHRKKIADFFMINKKVIKPTIDEIKKNPRSRSAKLRAICRV